jgi:Delta 1-pyrroline-5-carboxylate dehydrogenase
LDEAEHDLWKNSIEAGNLYINRGITGAIVNRQPFGGMKRSAFGGGIKAGGPNYVSCFVEFTEKDVAGGSEYKYNIGDLLTDIKEKARLNFAYDSYSKAWLNEFSKARDVNHLMVKKTSSAIYLSRV